MCKWKPARRFPTKTAGFSFLDFLRPSSLMLLYAANGSGEGVKIVHGLPQAAISPLSIDIYLPALPMLQQAVMVLVYI
jgi:hypothetical protein